MQSFMPTEVRDCDLLIVVTSSTFLKRNDTLKEKSSEPRSSKPAAQHTCRQMYFVHLYGQHVYCALVDLGSSGSPGVRPTPGLTSSTQVVCVYVRAMMMMIAFITIKSSLVPLIEGLDTERNFAQS